MILEGTTTVTLVVLPELAIEVTVVFPVKVAVVSVPFKFVPVIVIV